MKNTPSFGGNSNESMQVQAPEFALIQDLNVEVTENINENKEIIESINKIFSAAKAVDRLRIIKETSVLTESQTIELKNLIVQQNKDIRQAITQISGITDENKKIPGKYIGKLRTAILTLGEDKDYTQDELSILVTNTPKMILKTLVLSDNKAISLNNEKDLRAELNIKGSRGDNLVASMSITPEAYSALINGLINEGNFEKQGFSDKFFNSLIRNLRSDRNDDTNNSFGGVRIGNITKETFGRLIHTKHAWLVSLFEERNDLPDGYQTLLFERIKDFEPNRSSSTVTKLILTDKFENNDELRYLIESLQAKGTQQYNKVKDIINDIKTKIDLDRSLGSLRNKKTTRITINNESIEISDEKVYKLHNLFTKEKTKSL